MELRTFLEVMEDMVNHNLNLYRFLSQLMKDGVVSKMEDSMEVSMVNLKEETEMAIHREEATTVLRNHSPSGRSQSNSSTSTGQSLASI